MQTAPRAGHGDFTAGVGQCGNSMLAGTAGAPVLGNVLYGLQITTPIPTSFYSLMFGFGRCALGGTVPLPLDAGLLTPLASGCQLLVDPFLMMNGVATGNASVPLPIVPLPNLVGMRMYSQAVLVDLASNGVQATNGWAIAIGN